MTTGAGDAQAGAGGARPVRRPAGPSEPAPLPPPMIDGWGLGGVAGAAPGPRTPITSARVPAGTGPRGVPGRARARPPVVVEPGILGLSRHARGRIGSRLFTLFFVFVFATILIQLIVVLLAP